MSLTQQSGAVSSAEGTLPLLQLAPWEFLFLYAIPGGAGAQAWIGDPPRARAPDIVLTSGQSRLFDAGALDAWQLYVAGDAQWTTDTQPIGMGATTAPVSGGQGGTGTPVLHNLQILAATAGGFTNAYLSLTVVEETSPQILLFTLSSPPYPNIDVYGWAITIAPTSSAATTGLLQLTDKNGTVMAWEYNQPSNVGVVSQSFELISPVPLFRAYASSATAVTLGISAGLRWTGALFYT